MPPSPQGEGSGRPPEAEASDNAVGAAIGRPPEAETSDNAVGAVIVSPQENKDKNKNKNKSKSEKERKTEIKSETKTEPEPAPAETRGTGASEAGARGTDGHSPAGESGPRALSDRENREIIFPGAGAEQGGSYPEQRESPPEQQAHYAEMFRADPILASAWRDLLAQGPGVTPLAPGERERLLARLRAAPAWERLAILGDRMGSSLSRDWKTIRQRLQTCC